MLKRLRTTNYISLTSPGREDHLPSRLGGVFFLCIILAGCVLPTEDISDRQQIPGVQIRDALNISLYSEEIKILDNTYIAYSRFELVECLEAGMWIAGLEYRAEFHDCEEFAMATMSWVRGTLHGIPFGFGLRETKSCHAENLFIDEQLNVWVVDIKRHGSELICASGAFYFLVLI